MKLILKLERWFSSLIVWHDAASNKHIIAIENAASPASNAEGSSLLTEMDRIIAPRKNGNRGNAIFFAIQANVSPNEASPTLGLSVGGRADWTAPNLSTDVKKWTEDIS